MDDELYEPGFRAREKIQAAAPEQAALLPGLNNAYKAAGFVDNDVTLLVVIMGKDGFRIGSTAYFAFQYVHIGLGELGFTANGQVFSFIFSDIQPKLVTVHGRDLLRIWHLIGARRVPWIRQTDRDLRTLDGGADTEPVITRIEVADWKRPEERVKAPPRADIRQSIDAVLPV